MGGYCQKLQIFTPTCDWSTGLTFEELFTVLTMLEASLNSRPLSPMSSDTNDLAVLTSGHFLIGSSLQSLPSSKSTQKRAAEPTLQSHWKLVRSINNSFWDCWSKEYLSILQQRTKWNAHLTDPLSSIQTLFPYLLFLLLNYAFRTAGASFMLPLLNYAIKQCVN